MKQILLPAALAVVSGFAGAALWSAPEPAVRAQSFVLVDQAGKKHAEFTVKNGKALLLFYDEGGHITWAAPPSLQIMPVR